MSILSSILGAVAQSVRIERSAEILTPGARALICYRCDRELGPDHNEERCARKGSTRRFFLGGIAATVAGSAAVAVAAEGGVFGEKAQRIAIEAKKADPLAKILLNGFSGIRVNRGDMIVVGEGHGRASLGYSRLGFDSDDGSRIVRNGTLETSMVKNGRIVAKRDMILYSVHGENDGRIPFGVVGGDAKPIMQQATTDLETYMATRQEEANFQKRERQRRREMAQNVELAERPCGCDACSVRPIQKESEGARFMPV